MPQCPNEIPSSPGTSIHQSASSISLKRRDCNQECAISSCSVELRHRMSHSMKSLTSAALAAALRASPAPSPSVLAPNVRPDVLEEIFGGTGAESLGVVPLAPPSTLPGCEKFSGSLEDLEHKLPMLEGRDRPNQRNRKYLLFWGLRTQSKLVRICEGVNDMKQSRYEVQYTLFPRCLTPLASQRFIR